ncbi:(+)-menthofuran synthase-like [Triticum dicoccoides]|uniref:(+)-menthofuran synthase-like n=1 Tax=Triticum dicoccoides TaxID=85692 RepID=UPI000E7B36A8|nr:(+)-menthofuran synthase-like [Triticum dicoccoides]
MVAEMVVEPWNSPVLITLLAFLVVVITVLVSTRRGSNAPPSPRGLPVVGHLHLLGSLPHRSLRSLAASHGPVMHLRLGRVPTVVASSAAAAEEAMKTRDLDFAGRPRLLMVDRFYYGTGGIGFAPYGDHWRQARRVCAVHMLSARRVASLGRVRAQEAAALAGRISGSGGVVNLSDSLAVYSNAVISRCTLGDADCGVEGGGARLRKAFGEMEELLGTVPMGETVPWLRWVDTVTGLERRARRVFEDMDGLLERVIADHRQRRRAAAATGDEDEGDFVDVMLDADELDTDSIKSIILDVLAAATDSTFALLEWAMAELINHPHEMRRLQAEVRAAVGPGAGAVVTEAHLPRLPYLRAVINETLRLHPPSPLLLPRETLEDTRLLGYDVPAGTRVLINAWAIGRDPATWGPRAEEFAPERFVGYGGLGGAGQDFSFLPFGAGRRGCPGVEFAMLSNELALASLVHGFDWELPGGRAPPVGMSELYGLSVCLKAPLLLVAKPWSCMDMDGVE